MLKFNKKLKIKNRLTKIESYILFLILSLVWFTTSCSSTPEEFSLPKYSKDEWSDKVSKTIVEKQRAENVMNLGYQLIELTDSLQQEIETLSAESISLNERYETTEEEMQEVLEKFNEIRNRTFAKYSDIIFSMRSHVNADEWKELID